MAQLDYREQLNKYEMPLISSERGRSVLVSSLKSNSTNEEDNKPSVVYMQNVMPTERGLQSIGFNKIIRAPAAPNDTTELAGTVLLHNEYDTASFQWSAKGYYIAFEIKTGTKRLYTKGMASSSAWNLSALTTTLEPTVATVNGKSYMLTSSTAVVYYDFQTSALVATVFIAPPITFMRGITHAFGYLIAYNQAQVAWSSLLNPLDLAPSAITGAGFGTIEGARGAIVTCQANSKGFFIYCQYNVVAAVYTGNKAYPFKFTVVANSRGSKLYSPSADPYLVQADRIGNDPDSASHFMYSSTSGMQLVNSTESKPIFPELTDFLTGGVIEDFDPVTNTFSKVALLGSRAKKKVAYIGTRYLVVSYGVTELTHALIYDIALNKVGKIKRTHVDVFEHKDEVAFPLGIGSDEREGAKESIAFMDKTGEVRTVAFSTNNEATSGDVTIDGVLILGKYQYMRSRLLHLHKVVVENVEANDTFTLTDLVSLDGTNVSSIVVGTETAGTVGYRESYFPSVAGTNHMLVLAGQFVLNTLELLFTVGGRK